MQTREYKVLISYTRREVSISQSLYTGPHRRHATKAYQTACTLADHGILTNCVIRFFDGYKLRSDWEQDANTRHVNATKAYLLYQPLPQTVLDRLRSDSDAARAARGDKDTE